MNNLPGPRNSYGVLIGPDTSEPFRAVEYAKGDVQRSIDRQNNQFKQKESTADRDLQRYLADNTNATSRFGTTMGNRTTRQGNQLNYASTMKGLADKQGRFSQMFGLLGSTLGDFKSQFGGTAGGYGGGGPQIDAGPVFSDSMIQQQVNAQRAGNDMATGGAVRGMNAGLAQRGFGTGSPLAQALSGNLFGKNLAANTANERDTRMNAAQTNAGHVLDAQKAREAQYASRQQEGIGRTNAYTGGLASLLGVMGGYG